MSNASSSPSSLSFDGDKENAGQRTKNDGKRNRFNNRLKKRTTNKVESEIFIKKGDPKLKGCHCQRYGEPGRKPSQCARTTNKVKAELSKERDCAHLIEPALRGDEIDCKEQDDPGDEASRVESMR